MTLKRVADVIADCLAAGGIRDVFLVTGGGAMHLNDAIGRNPGLKYLACHHEQACAIAAESYFRMSGRLAAVNVTTGPGGINALNGVWGAWVDSCGMVVVSGQVKFETTIASTDLPLRQLGDQEADIITMVKSITKYAVMVTDPKEVVYHLERAIHLARSGRPGPTWIDVPMNVQGAKIDPSQVRHYDPAEDQPVLRSTDLAEDCRKVLAALAAAKRPCILSGAGVRISRSHEKFLRLVEKLGIPVTTGWNAHDVIWNEHPQYVGRPSIVGDRAGNFAVQNSDFLLVLGSRLNIRQISYNWQSFARAAHKVMVDVDAAELDKPTLAIDHKIHADLGDFLDQLLELPYAGPTQEHRSYLTWCRARKDKYPVVLPEYWAGKDAVNPYCFVEALFKQLKDGDRIVTGDGTACVTTLQAAYLRPGQRLYTNSGCASMGYDLPAAVGACIAESPARLICLAGDGSIMMNLQELETISSNRLPIKVFVLNNRGYHSIRQTQHSYFPDNIVGCGTESGLGFPNFEKLAEGFSFAYRRAERHADLEQRIRETIESPGPQLCEVVLDLEQQFAPKLTSRRLPDGKMVSSPLEDMAPFLPREELAQNLLIEAWPE